MIKVVINSYIHYRFEPNIDNGTLYIYNSKNRKIVKSNYTAYKILKLIDDGNSYEELMELFRDSQAAVISFLDTLKMNDVISG